MAGGRFLGRKFDASIVVPFAEIGAFHSQAPTQCSGALSGRLKRGDALLWLILEICGKGDTKTVKNALAATVFSRDE